MQTKKLTDFSVQIKTDLGSLNEIIPAVNKTAAIFNGIKKMNKEGVASLIRAEKMIPIERFNAPEQIDSLIP